LGLLSHAHGLVDRLIQGGQLADQMVAIYRPPLTSLGPIGQMAVPRVNRVQGPSWLRSSASQKSAISSAFTGSNGEPLHLRL
jgi:hypothetical protein